MLAKNVGASMKPILTLVQILGASTFFCGMLTGTFFGFNLYGNDIPFFNKMRDLFFLDNQWMFNLSLILGAVQIIFGMILKAANQTIQFGLKYALSTIGWIIVLVSTALAFLLGDTMPMGGTVHLVILGLAAMVMQFLHEAYLSLLLHRFVGRTVFAYAESVVAPNELDRYLHQCRHTHGGFHIVAEHKESTTSRDDTAV